MSGKHGETVSLSPCVSGKPSFALEIGTKNSIIRLKMKENINGNERKAVVPSGTYCIVLSLLSFVLLCVFISFIMIKRLYKVVSNSVYSLLSNASHSCSAAMSRSQWSRNYLFNRYLMKSVWKMLG